MMQFITFFYLIVSSFCASPAVIFNVQPPTGNIVKALSTVNVLSGNLTGYYYATEVFFEDGQIGYFGMQPRTDKELQHLTYSVFGKGPTSDHPNCTSGADSGSGISCFAEYPWKFNHNYTFVMERVGSNETDGSNTWRGTFVDDETNEEFIVAEYTTPESYGLMRDYNLCFDEYYPDNTAATPSKELHASSYIQYAPKLVGEDGKEFQTQFVQWSGDLPASVKHTKVNPYAVKFENGVPPST